MTGVSNAHGVIVIGHEDYMTWMDMTIFGHFVSNGETILFL
jgi:hypothetical protein